MSIIGSIAKLGSKLLPKTGGIGNKIGKTNKYGQSVFAKEIKASNHDKGIKYTVLDADKNIVQKKEIWQASPNERYGNVWDKDGNLISHFSQTKQNTRLDLACSNKFATETRNIRETYNKYGQVTSLSDVTIKPDYNFPLCFEKTSYINGSSIRSYLVQKNNHIKEYVM